MKKICLWRTLTLLLAVTASSAWAASPANVVVTYAHPEKFSSTSTGYFTDFVVQDRSERETAARFAREMPTKLGPILAKVAPGCTLTFQFTDIDLGGRYHPGLGPNFRHIGFSPNLTVEDIQLKYDEFYFEQELLKSWIKTNVNVSSPAPTINQKR